MSQINWDLFKCRASASLKLMSNGREGQQITEKQLEELKRLEAKENITDKQKQELARLQLLKDNSGKVVLGDTCIEHLMEYYAWETVGAVAVAKQFEMPQMKKGKLGEQDAIALLSIVDNVIYEKYEGERISNDYLSGLPDIYTGEHVMKADTITDIKNSFDYPTFLKQYNKPIEKDYEWQLKSYGDISSAKTLEVARCLVNMPEVMQNDYKKKLFYQGEYVTEESPEFLKKWEELHRSMNFDKIPHHKKVFKLKVEPFTDFERQSLYDRVKYCRDWLWKFDEQYQKLNL